MPPVVYRLALCFLPVIFTEASMAEEAQQPLAPTPTLSAPDTSPPGKLIIARVQAPQEWRAAWDIIPMSDQVTLVRDQDWVVFDNGFTMAFATPTPGTYQIVVAVANGPDSRTLALLRHKITIEGQTPNPPNPPVPPTPPTPTPNNSWAELAMKTAMSKVQSPRASQAAALAKAMRTAATKVVELPDLRKARELVRQMAGEALGQSYARWGEWSEAIGAEMARRQSEITDVEVYAGILRAIATGLEAVTD